MNRIQKMNKNLWLEESGFSYREEKVGHIQFHEAVEFYLSKGKDNEFANPKNQVKSSNFACNLNF